MSNRKRRNGAGDGEDTRWMRLYMRVCAELPQLAGVAVKNPEDFDRLTLINRGYDWLAIVKGYDKDGAPVVCFGSGEGLIGALIGANGAIAANRWKPDKPWEPEK